MNVDCTAWLTSKHQLYSASRDLTEDRSINLQYTNDQLLLKLLNYERCIYLPVCTEIITVIIVLDWIGLCRVWQFSGLFADLQYIMLCATVKRRQDRASLV